MSDTLAASIKRMYVAHYDDFTINALVKTIGAEDSQTILAICTGACDEFIREGMFDGVAQDKRKVVGNITAVTNLLLRKYPARKGVDELVIELHQHRRQYSQSRSQLSEEAKKNQKHQEPWGGKDFKNSLDAIQIALDVHLDTISRMNEKESKSIMKVYDEYISKGADLHVARNHKLPGFIPDQVRFQAAKCMVLGKAIEQVCGKDACQKIMTAIHLEMNKKLAALQNAKALYA